MRQLSGTSEHRRFDPGATQDPSRRDGPEITISPIRHLSDVESTVRLSVADVWGSYLRVKAERAASKRVSVAFWKCFVSRTRVIHV